MTTKFDGIIPPGYSKPKKLRSGAFGQVLKVTHEGSGVEYAVKVLPMLKEGDKERVSREVEMLTRFAHARIVHLHESIDMGGHQAIVMELGTRSDLGGSAAFEQHMTQTTGEFGTFEYNSPERVMDSKGTGTAASDVWSLGVVAYRMVTGRGLFEGLTLPQLCHSLDHFSESKIPTTIHASVRAVLVKMLEPNVALRATTSALLKGGLLEGMLGSSTDLSRMKSIQLATLVNEIKESLNDAEVEERTMELSMEKKKLLLETQDLEIRLRSLQKSLQRTRSRNVELEKEEEFERCQQLLATHPSPISISTEDNVLSTKLEMPGLLFYKDSNGENCQRALFDVSGITITRTGVDKDQEWRTTLFDEPISEGVVSVAITILAIPEAKNSKEGLMFGLVDAQSGKFEDRDQLGSFCPNSVAIAPKDGILHIALPSTKQRDKTMRISHRLSEGDRVVLEVDMDARPRTAVFIINGNVPLTFVSGLPPSIRFGLSMKNEGVSVRFDGMSRLKRATPLRRVNEIKWNPKDLLDSDDMYMNGLRSSVLTVETQMPSLVFSDPSHFTVEDNRIASTGLATEEKDGKILFTWSSFFLSEPISEGIVAISFTPLVYSSSNSSLGFIDAQKSIPETGQCLGEIKNSIAFSSFGQFFYKTDKGEHVIDATPPFQNGDSLIVEINMDSNPRKAQFFVDGKSVNVIVVGLPESVRVGFSTKGRGILVRFDRIIHLNRGSPITNLMEVVEWPAEKSLQATESEKHSINRDTFDNDATSVDDGDSEEDTDEENSHSDDDSDDEDDGPAVKKNRRQLPTMKLPELLFTDKSHFLIGNNVLTRTEKGTDERGRTRSSSILLAEPFTKGVVSVTFDVLTIAESGDEKGFITFGLLDSSRAVPPFLYALGKNVKHSLALSTSYGELPVFIRSRLETDCCSPISKNDRVVMEVNMDSTPRTVQFFVNGKAGKCYVSGIPESVRIGFSADVMGTSLQIATIVHSTQATPLSGKMKEFKWTDTEDSFFHRTPTSYRPIRREAEGSMPALLCRNPEHFKIEGNVITRTAFDFDGLNSPFSTVMVEVMAAYAIMSVTVTILALPETEHSCGVVMIGCLMEKPHIPKGPKGLGFQKSDSYALCSSDGMLNRSDMWKTTSNPCSSPLKVGDRVELKVNPEVLADNSRFFVNGKAGLNDVSDFASTQRIGFSLAGPGTSIRIDAVKGLDKQDPMSNTTCSGESCRIF
ncbi:hypothetical protein BLNAU_17547 [Blattamonas nauphoetae]|uniref:non-specific serine/threonine protein kinase n=1 Tax=Blattamonas nauphoetae TaxID=2049346 RepID=A0ABQ9X747_9EUKA|nr:hypothetical protein BLNAU_17547 [Blattamonas nauphoetae]